MNKPSETLTSNYYTDPAYYEIEKEKIFYRTRQFVCHATDIAEPGMYQTMQIADENIVVLRDSNGGIQAFYNVCRHRAHRVVDGEGKCQRLTCPYHAWTYGLDGKLVRAPGTEEIDGFDPGPISLRSVRVENFCGLIFANLNDDAQSIDELYPELRAEVEAVLPGLPNMTRVHVDHIQHDCNWKVSVENYSECYHCAVVHKYVTANLYSGTEYRISTDNGYVRRFSPALRDREVNGDLEIWMLWPNCAIQTYPYYRSLSIRLFQSTGPRASTYTYFMFIDPDLTDEQRAEVVDYGANIYHSNNALEDSNIVRSVQQGLESRSYEKGHLVLPPVPSAESEIGVAYFQQQYLKAMTESA